MNATATLAKTDKGIDEVTRHAYGLPNRLRSLLITVDGRATAGAIISRFGAVAETETRLQYLIDQGFVEEAPAWNPTLLKQIETHLTRFVGPLAQVLVRHASKETRGVDELYAKLAEKLDPADAPEFVATLDRLFGPLRAAPAARSRGERKAARDEPPGWNPALLEEVETHLTRFVGPIARVMVRRARAQTSDLEELYEKLADQLETTD